MSFNNLMHPRNLYKNAAPKFEKLGQKSADFRQYLKETRPGHWTVNFKDPEALRALTRVLLAEDFGLSVTLPLDRLIPTVPLRLNYILWIEDLLAYLPAQARGTTIRGFDIGTGASAIYPLLGAKLNGWHFFATEVDEASLVYAKQNISRNNFDHMVKVRKVSPESYLKAALENEDTTMQFDFCMCNPPFFTSLKATISSSRTDRRPQPNAVCTGSESEMVTSGGEVEFVNGIIADSLLLKEQFSWYTTMLGKKASVSPVIASLKSYNVSTIASTEFGQGRVMRWGVAWSFLPGVIVEDSPTKQHKHQKKNKTLQILVPEKYISRQMDSCLKEPPTKTQMVVTSVMEILKAFKIDVEEVHDGKDHSNCAEMEQHIFHCMAIKKTWANQRRKRREMKRQCEEGELNSDDLKNETSEEKGDDGEENKGRETELNNDDANRCTRALESMSADTSLTASCDTKEQQIPAGEQTGSSCSFFVRVGQGAAICLGRPADSVVLEMEWIDGNNKNDLYQLYQYFQNKIVKEL